MCQKQVVDGIQCDQCLIWLHFQCLGIKSTDTETLPVFYCPTCALKRDIDTTPIQYSPGSQVSFYDKNLKGKLSLLRGSIRSVHSENPLFYEISLLRSEVKIVSHHEIILLQSETSTQSAIEQQPYSDEAAKPAESNGEELSAPDPKLRCSVCNDAFPEQPTSGTAMVCVACSKPCHMACVTNYEQQKIYVCPQCDPISDSPRPDNIPSLTEKVKTLGAIQAPLFTAEDATGSMTLPMREHFTPAADYYSQKLTITAEIFAMPVERKCCVHLIDNRISLKSGHLFCTMRYRFFQWIARTREKLPDFYWGVRDNLVKENKSMQVLYFFIMMTVLLNMKGGCACYLLPGHSHNAADRYGALAKNTLKFKNLFTIQQVASCMRQSSQIDSVEIIEEVLDWSAISNLFLRFPTGFTKYYIYTWLIPKDGPIELHAFKYVGGAVTSWRLVDDVKQLRRSICTLLYNKPTVSPQEALSLSPMLPVLNPRGLAPEKVAAIRNVLWSVPSVFHPWYKLYCDELKDSEPIDNAALSVPAPMMPLLTPSARTRLSTFTRANLGSDKEILSKLWGQLSPKTETEEKKDKERTV